MIDWLRRGAFQAVKLAVSGSMPWTVLSFLEAYGEVPIDENNKADITDLKALIVREFMSVNGRPVAWVRNVGDTPRFPSASDTDPGNIGVTLFGNGANVVSVQVSPPFYYGKNLLVRYLREPSFAVDANPAESISESVSELLLAFGVIVGARDIGDEEAEKLGVRMRDEALKVVTLAAK